MDSSRALFELSDDNVLSNLHKATLAGHRRLKQVLLYLGEVEERRLHLKGAFTSMFDFCVRSLGMSDGEAYRRIGAARLVRTFPRLLEWIGAAICICLRRRRWCHPYEREAARRPGCGRSRRDEA